MKTLIKLVATTICIFLSTLSCSKKAEQPNCETWRVLYWQGKADHTTVTTNYTPNDGEKEVCGSEKASVAQNKTVVLSQSGNDLFNYMTFEAKIR